MSSCKRWIAALIAAVIMVSLAVPAWAVDTYTLSITSETKGHNYKAYQVFGGTIAKAPGTDTDTLVNIVWGNGVNGSALLNALKTAEFTNPEYTPDSGKPQKITPFASVTSAQDVADVLTGWGPNAVQLDEFAEVVGAHLNEDNAETPTTKETESTEKGKKIYTTTFTGLDAGYYLLCEDNMDPDADKNNAYTKFILELVRNTTVEAKADAPSMEKKILESPDAEQGMDTTVASVGDSVYFDLTGTVPSMDGYDKYFYIIVDTLSKGLTFDSEYEYFLSIYRENGDLEATVAKGDLQDDPKYTYTVTPTVNMDGTTTLEIVINNAIQLKDFAGGKVCFTYRATLNQDAVIGNSGNPNSVHLEYSNDPNYDYQGTNEPTGNDPMGQTPEDYVIVYTGAVQVRKVDSNRKALTGAGFTLTGQGTNQVKVTTNSFTPDPNGKYYKLKNGTYTTEAPDGNEDAYESTTDKYSLTQNVTWTGTNTSNTTIAGDVGQDGYLTFGGLGEGTYTIEETTVPTGYNKIDNITVTLSFTPPEGEITTGQETGTWSATYKVGSNGSSHAASVDTDGTIHFQVENRSGAVLPSTGGMGTTLFVAGGLVLMVVAATLLVVRARAARKDQEENQN